jgi:hypothetical protein
MLHKVVFELCTKKAKEFVHVAYPKFKRMTEERCEIFETDFKT